MKWKLVWTLTIAPHIAMPTAPPRLRIMLERPLAYLRRSLRQAAEAQCHRRRNREDLRESAEDLRHQQLAAAPSRW